MLKSENNGNNGANVHINNMHCFMNLKTWSVAIYRNVRVDGVQVAVGFKVGALKATHSSTGAQQDEWI